MRIGVVLAIGLSTASTAHADLAQDKAKLRLEAEKHEKDAKQRGDDATYVKCGQAYLDIYNLDTMASDIDEVLYNAAVCFEQGHSTGLALSLYRTFEKYAPNSRLRPKVLARMAKILDTLAMLSEAADKLEQYAKSYAGEKDAYQALSDAVFIRRGLGDDEKMIEDVRYFVRAFGAKQPQAAASAMYALTEVYRHRAPAELERHLRDWLRRYSNADADTRVRATFELGEAVWKRACAVPTVDGLCLKVTRSRVLPIATKTKVTLAAQRCGPATSPVITVVPRDPKLAQEAIALFAQVEKLSVPTRPSPTSYFQARAQLLVADHAVEQTSAVKFPRGLDFSPGRASEASRKKFEEFLRTRTTLGEDALKKYVGVIAVKDPAMSIAAMQRIGFLGQALAAELQTGEIPKDVRSGTYAKDKLDAFCTTMTDVAEPLVKRAIDAYDACLAKATELGVRDDATRACARERANLGPTTYPLAAELLPEAPLPLPITGEEPLRKNLPQPLRDQVEKFWPFYGATPIPTDKCLPLAQGFERIAKQSSSADAWFMAGVTYGRCQREMTANAKSAYIAALAIDPKHGKSVSNLGELAARTGALDVAKVQWEKAIALDPKLFAAQLGLATLELREYRALPATAPARRQLHADIEHHAQIAAVLGNSGSALPYVQLGVLALLDNQQSLAKYFAAVAQKVEDGPHGKLLYAAIYKGETLSTGYLLAADAGSWKIPETRLALAIQQLALARFDDAAKTLAQVAPSYEALIARGVAARGLGKLADAEARYTEASKLDPARVEAHFNLGVLFKDHIAARATDPAAAKTAFKKAADAFRRANTPEAKLWADDCDKAVALL